MPPRDRRRIGVSPSLISQIERDKVNPSVSTLWGARPVLGLTMGDLFAESTRPGGLPAPGRRVDPATAPGNAP